MAVSMCRRLVAICVFTTLLSLVRCADDSRSERPQKQQHQTSSRGVGKTGTEDLQRHQGPGSKRASSADDSRSERPQKQEHQASSRGVGKTGTEDLQKHQGPGSKRASSGLQREDLDCDCRKGERDASSQKKGRDGKRGGKGSGRDAHGLRQGNHTFDAETFEGRNATWKRQQEDRNASRNGNETRIRGRHPLTQRPHGKGEEDRTQESKGKCDCDHAGSKNMPMAKEAGSRTGKGGCKSNDDSQQRGKGKRGRFLQGKRRGGGCDENDGMSLPIALGTAGAGLGALCIAAGLLCVCLCWRRRANASVAPNEKASANNVVICDVEKPVTCEGVLPTSVGVVVGNPASTA